MAVRTARWATRLGAVLRPIATVVGGTFAVHRLSARIEAPGSSATYLEAMEQALELPDPVPAALARTLALGLVGAVLGLVVGAVAAVVWHRRFDHDHPVRRGGGLIGACALGLFVPGLVWLPIERLVDPDLRAEPPSLGAGGVGPLLLWGLVIGLAVAPTAAATLGPRRPWGPAGQIDGSVPLGLLVTRSSGQRWHLGLPVLPFGLTLATTEVVSGNEGLFDRFHRSAASGDPELLVALALPVVVIAAGLVAAAGIAPALVDQRPRPIPAGATGPGRRRGHDLVVALLGLAVIAAAVAGWAAGPGALGAEAALQTPTLGGPWLGTDADGRGLAATTGSALAVTLVASIVPALAATAVGGGLAVFKRALGGRGRALVEAALDLLSWPAALVVPVAAMTVADGQPLLDPVVLQVTGLLLVPSAARLLAVEIAGPVRRLGRLVATAFVLSALALAANLLAGYLAAGRGGDRADLGRLVSVGLGSFDASPWPVSTALAAAALSAIALYGAADALWPRRRRRSMITAQGATDEDLRLGSLRPEAAVPTAAADLVIEGADATAGAAEGSTGSEFTAEDPGFAVGGVAGLDGPEVGTGEMPLGHEMDPGVGLGVFDRQVDPDGDRPDRAVPGGEDVLRTDDRHGTDEADDRDRVDPGDGGDNDGSGPEPVLGSGEADHGGPESGAEQDEGSADGTNGGAEQDHGHDPERGAEQGEDQENGGDIEDGLGPIDPVMDEGGERDEPTLDIRDGVTVDSVIDLPGPEENDEIGGGEDDATRTVELRPSDLRQAGVEPPPDD